ncbi:MAG: pyruvate dehydrogenase (acetyl-transferring) E1 component subunit alpha, partial [Thermogemmatispora sp.]|nr:pyruvate dehydrogenase (acetyl-transferring) E1 component subunit alpha [Thermogemmatispora sp.]
METRQQRKAAAQGAGSNAPRSPASLLEGTDRETLLNYYYQMVLIRYFEEKAGE